MKMDLEGSPVRSAADLIKRLPPDHSVRYYYRGESDSAWKLVPKLARPGTLERLTARYNASNIIELERLLLQRFRRYASHYHLEVSTGLSPVVAQHLRNGYALPNITAYRRFCSTGPLARLLASTLLSDSTRTGTDASGRCS